MSKYALEILNFYPFGVGRGENFKILENSVAVITCFGVYKMLLEAF